MKVIKIFCIVSFFIQIGYAQKNIQSQNKICDQSNDISRIVSIGGSITEIIYYLEKEKNIVAIDVTSVYPKQAKKKPSIGYIRNVSSEGVLSMNPSIVISEDDIGPPLVINQLKKSDIDLRIIKENRDIYGILDKVRCIGKILGLDKKTEEKISKELSPLISKIEKIKSNHDIKDKKIMMILSMQGTSPVVAGSETSGHSFIQMLGAKNIYESIKGWKSVTSESILNLNPDYIILPNKEMHKNSNVNMIINHNVFKETNAGKNNAYIVDDGMAILGYSPRTITAVLNSLNKIVEFDQ